MRARLNQVVRGGFNRGLPWGVAEFKEREEPEGGEAESDEGGNFEEVDGVGRAALDGSLLHGIDALKNGLKGIGVTGRKDLATGHGGHEGDGVGGGAFRDMDAVEDDVVVLEALGNFDVFSIEEISALPVRNENDHAVTFLGREEDFFGFFEGFANGCAPTEPFR